ncbi:MAG: hypothetical protein Kow0075_13530 [Salibacteraceae bacterium]
MKRSCRKLNMTKRIIGIAAICCLIQLPSLVVAQDENSTQVTESGTDEANTGGNYFSAGQFGVTFNASGLVAAMRFANRTDLIGNAVLTGRYVYNDRLIFRVGLAPKVYAYNETRSDSVGKDLVQFDTNSRQAMFSILPGIEYHINTGNRLDPYVGIELEAGLVGTRRAGSVRNFSDTTGTARYTRTVTEAGGFSIGARLFTGMNFFIAKGFAFGFEYGVGLRNITTGGDRQEVLQSEPVSGTSSVQRDLSSGRVSQTYFMVDPAVQFTLSYYF